MEFLIVGVGGFLGAIARYSIYLLERVWLGSGFPVATLVVNVLACSLAGLVVGVVELKLPVAPSTLLLVSMGFLGAFSTFSTFAVENLFLIRNEQIYSVALNIGLSLVLGIFAVALGRWGAVAIFR